jgi:RING finger protein 113A
MSDQTLEDETKVTKSHEDESTNKEEEDISFTAFKRKRPKNIRKKPEDIQKSTEKEQKKDDEQEKHSDSDDKEHTIKKPKLHKGIISSTTKGKSMKEESVTFTYQSSKTAVPAGHPDQGATATLEIDPEKSEDKPQIENSDGIYRGMSAYRSYVKKGQTAVPGKAGGFQVGPIRSPSNVRITARFDYQPDICKDYKETGYCGFGDSCKFLHDRGDYKTGWQLEREWEEEQRKKKERALQRFLSLGTETNAEETHDNDEKGEYYVGDSDDEELPFACFICRQPFKSPVVTLCGHYFCEDCALNHYRKDTRCFICKEQTKGIFNTAHKIIRKQKKIAEMKAKKSETAHEGDSSDTSNITERGDADTSTATSPKDTATDTSAPTPPPK